MLAFPTNDFHQELPNNEAIQAFVKENFPEVTFPVFGTSVLEENPAYQALHQQMPNGVVRHNFYKYLVDRHGNVVDLYEKKVNPLLLVDDIQKVLDDTQHQVPKTKMVLH